MSAPLSDIAIARQARKAPITQVASRLAIPEEAVIPYGRDKAKIDGAFLRSIEDRPAGRLILVTAINPTPAGEGKTTTTVGLGDGLSRIGKRVAIALREPSLGPCFGQKGGAAGGGYAQVVPMEDINLHFTGDFHAITAAHNLLAAMVDNHIHWGNALGIDPRRVLWRRVVDMNDRALRDIVQSLGGPANGLPRESGFDITVASEVMAILCLARDLEDLEARLGRIVVAERADRSFVTARDLKADGAMAALLRDAMMPNLVQTLENTPAFVHGGPFANIAHGCNSVAATRAALRLADYVVTEAGFGADLGAEKFFDIKCRQAGLKPDATVVVATVRALKMNGGVARAELGREDVDAVRRGAANLRRHVENCLGFGVPVIVAINHFTSDTQAEIGAVREAAAASGVEAVLCRHWAEGSAGIVELAEKVAALADGGTARFHPLYGDALPLREKIEAVVRRIYRGAAVSIDPPVLRTLDRYAEAGFADLPVCMAKTPYSFSTDPSLLGAPEGHAVHVREVRLSAGAGFVVAICGDVLTMPGLPRVPAAESIRLDEEGRVEGLF
ncbi:formate--tetrahydrofolate ligase [Aureimonas jatrophae]|uniref:formate--tetrahydrofolate ligase n=1 Tax=Aureimonas jatrophae TaxID=1166073 RepID=UPI0018354048|nr:formate--tetrahydrofolate ligase [Aureimonas jatrophae]MBB3950434.1 formate--tetrahydrofolate ligase [Aureimonas jatrophae]